MQLDAPDRHRSEIARLQSQTHYYLLSRVNIFEGSGYARTGAVINFSFKVSNASWHLGVQLNVAFSLVILCKGFTIFA